MKECPSLQLLFGLAEEVVVQSLLDACSEAVNSGKSPKQTVTKLTLAKIISPSTNTENREELMKSPVIVKTEPESSAEANLKKDAHEHDDDVRKEKQKDSISGLKHS